MKNSFKYYGIIWGIIVVVFNVITFTVTDATVGLSEVGASYWISYVVIMLAFLGNVVFSNYFFNSSSKESLFLKMSAMQISVSFITVSLAVGVTTMIFNFIPYWLGIIINGAIIALYASQFVAALWAGKEVERIDKKVKTQTFFIKSLTVDAEMLMQKASSAEVKEEAKKVYEAVRYSDPMSDDALSGLEAQITLKFSELSEAVENDNIFEVRPAAKNVILLVNERNKKCKLLK